MTRNYLLLIFIASTFVSCFGDKVCTEAPVDPDSKSWVDIYDFGQKFIFESNLGGTDTFEVVEINRTTIECNEAMNRFKEYERYYVRFMLLNRRVEYDGDGLHQIIINLESKESDDYEGEFDVTTLDIGVFDLGFYEELSYRDSIWIRMPDDYEKEGGYLRGFSWSKTNGLQNYETLDGEIYTLKNNPFYEE